MAEAPILVSLLNYSTGAEDDETLSGSSSSQISNKSKSRGQNKAYSLIGTFDSKESIDIEIKERHKEFCYFYTRNTKAGKKIFYRCRHSKVKGTQCSSGLYIIMPADNLKFQLYSTSCKNI